jgi:hypothetical protein
MKIKFFTPSELDKNLKATVHKTGKLGFTIEAAKKMELTPAAGLSIGINETEANDDSLYVLVQKQAAHNSFKINRSGDYFYVNTKALFDKLKIDYTNHSIYFDITEEEIDSQKIYKLHKKVKPAKAGKNN